VGQAAWFCEKYRQWTDDDGDPEQALSRGEMLDDSTLYWLKATAAASARIYWQSMRSFKEHRIEVPVGYSQLPRDIHRTNRCWVQERYPTPSCYDELAKGGHFAAWKQLQVLDCKLRANVRRSHAAREPAPADFRWIA
jgi:hypothetical protein